MESSLKTIQDVIDKLQKDMKSGDKDLEMALRTSISVLGLIQNYAIKHDLVLTCGGEYIYQDDNAQVDAIELVSNLCKALSQFS